MGHSDMKPYELCAVLLVNFTVQVHLCHRQDCDQEFLHAADAACVPQPTSVVTFGCCFRLFPASNSFHPTILNIAAPATFAHLVRSSGSVLWVPDADTKLPRAGSWVSVAQGCFPPLTASTSSCIVNVARRAGLPVPDVPEHILKVC